MDAPASTKLLCHWTGGTADTKCARVTWVAGWVEGFGSINGSMPSQDAGFWLIGECATNATLLGKGSAFSAATQITCCLLGQYDQCFARLLHHSSLLLLSPLLLVISIARAT
jgi:hypothetical protein